jgi:WD40 repeat protein
MDVATGHLTGRRVHLPGFPYSTVTPTPDGSSLWVDPYVYAPGAQIATREYHARSELAKMDIASGRFVLGVHGVRRAAVSSRGQVVTADWSAGIEARDARTLQPVEQLAGSRGLLDQLAFSSDGGLLIATGDEGTVQLYDTSSWTRLAEIPSEAPEGVVEGWLRPDGLAVAVNTEQGVAEWTLVPKQLAAAACELAGRNLTRAEWATYLPDQPYHRSCPDYPAGT